MILQHLDPQRINAGDLIVADQVDRLVPEATPVVAGTPWFWDRCEQSEKYAWLADVLRKHENPIAVGVGACLPPGYDVSLLLNNPETVTACASLWSKFKKVIVRDPVAHEFLLTIGVENTLLPCPSVFCDPIPEVFLTPNPGSTLVIATQPWDDSPYAPPKLPDIEGDVTYLNYGYGVRQDPYIFLRFAAQFETVISARVHAVLPLIGHRRTSVISTDSRHLAATHAGIPTHPLVREPVTPEVRREWFAQYEEELG